VRVLRWFLVFVPLAFAAHYGFHSDVLTFVCAGVGLVPLAGLLGEATEELAVRTGPKVGGLLNATLGNAAELIITIVALKAGKLDLVKASIVGSILGNLLLILGFSLLLGGLKNGKQTFDRGMAGTGSTMMFLSVIGLLVPTLFEIVHRVAQHVPVLGIEASTSRFRDPSLESLSLGVSALLMIVYVLSLVHSFTGPDRHVPVGVEEVEPEAAHGAAWPLGKSIAVLAVATVFTVFLSELLVGAVEPVVRKSGMPELFLGVVLIPLVGNVAEHLVAVQTAWKNKMDLSLAISLGSSMQIALFVAPLLTFVSVLFGGERLTLFFDPFQVLVLGLSVLIAGQISVDGESNWLEGAQLLAVYVMSALGFLYL
jgi:Ca2+:H+ antiporter